LEIIKWVFAISGANTVKNKPKPVVSWPLGYLKTRKLQFSINIFVMIINSPGPREAIWKV
jgi:hypothetical protein